MLPASVARGLATTAATAAASSVAVRRWSSLLLSRPAASKFPIPRKSVSKACPFTLQMKFSLKKVLKTDRDILLESFFLH